MKNLRYLESAAATSLMLSKYFLAISSILGWWLSIIGYILTAILNIKIKLRIVAVIVIGLSLLSVYGLYKWEQEINGLQIIDYIIISLSGIMATALIIYEAKHKKPFWFLQSIATLAFMLAFIALGLKLDIGWHALLIGHINNMYLYYQKQAYIIGVMQIISIIIVLTKIL
ncbi:nicotinamide mononucleotide transporter [Patescibacteria group bacterium]|nr:nicotinamide mononucleotide transporter [Patescibacteria group bacterium]